MARFAASSLVVVYSLKIVDLAAVDSYTILKSMLASFASSHSRQTPNDFENKAWDEYASTGWDGHSTKGYAGRDLPFYFDGSDKSAPSGKRSNSDGFGGNDLQGYGGNDLAPPRLQIPQRTSHTKIGFV
jgi:hypothetical protein